MISGLLWLLRTLNEDLAALYLACIIACFVAAIITVTINIWRFRHARGK